MKNKFLALQNLLSPVRQSRHEAEIKKAVLRAQREKYQKNPKDWEYEIGVIDKKIKEIDAGLANARQSLLESVITMSQDLAAAIVERQNQPLDLSDSKLVNALQYASLAKLDHAQATEIASQFRGNQKALALLRDTFKDKGISSGVDALIYDPSTLQDKLTRAAHDVSNGNSSPESLMQYLGKIANLEGITDLPAVDMGQAVMDAVNKGAGLPDPDVAKAIDAARQSTQQS